MDGELQSLPTTTFVGDQSDACYKARVNLANAVLGSPSRRLLPGMTAKADIVTGSKTLLQYLLKSIHKNLDSAFTKR